MSSILNKSDFLKVSDKHTIYYEVCGNKNSEPILFLHGGPGMGFSDNDKRFFDFNKQLVIFFDQRGASRSIPYACTEENTTQNLVNDINKLLDFLNIKKVLVFGGSWGTTLGLVYAIQYPERVKGLLLRGVFINDKESIEHYLNGGVAKLYPKIWKRFSQNVPNDTSKSIIDYYFDKIKNGTDKEKMFFSYEWSFYEISIYKEYITQSEVEQILNRIPYQSLSIMEIHYLSNKCFLKDNYILDNISEINQIPVKIVHGKNDAICPVTTAIKLDSLLEKSELFIVDGGHSDSEPNIEKKLSQIIEDNMW